MPNPQKALALGVSLVLLAFLIFSVLMLLGGGGLGALLILLVAIGAIAIYRAGWLPRRLRM